jgi:acyl-CoA reductase-like NAD-dependent aldehyde dehydrogenase
MAYNYLNLLYAIALCTSISRVGGAEYSCTSPDSIQKPPKVNGMKAFFGGEVKDYEGLSEDIYSPIISKDSKEKFIIGKLAQMSADDSLRAVQHAKEAYNFGQGVWPQMPTEERIKAIENVVMKLKERRDEIIHILQWEICKNTADAISEFDRTIIFIESSIEEVRTQVKESSGAISLLVNYVVMQKNAHLTFPPFSRGFTE